MRSSGTKNLDQLDINDPRTMDRLVDGELTDEQERAVIVFNLAHVVWVHDAGQLAKRDLY